MCNDPARDSLCPFPKAPNSLCSGPMIGAEQRQQEAGGIMRLICPNCGAQYEVPDEVIPTNGRDVQCSNCGDTWFQRHHSHVPAASSDDDLGPSPDEHDEYDVPPPAVPAEHNDAEEDDDDDDDDFLQDTPEPVAARPVRRGVDPAVADILRQEAERERQVRSAAGGIETQPDLGLSEPEMSEDERTRQARARMERLRGGSGVSTPPESVVVPDTHASIDPSSRRNLLPDIEEINSSLTSTEDRAESTIAPLSEEMELPAQRGGFRSGFRLSVVTFALAALVYVLAPLLAKMVPSAEAPLEQYVEAVNAARVWLDQIVGSASGWF